MSYNAIIAKLENVRKHSNADRLMVANCLGEQVIVSLESKDGDIVILFPSDGQLSEKYCYENNIYNKAELNSDKKSKGYFSENRRVRTQAFRGEKSEAYVAPLSTLKFTGYNINKLSVGDSFTDLNGMSICNKYITEATIRAARANTPKTQSGFNKKELKKIFPEHFDTEQVKYANDYAFLGLNIIAAKLHGTSGRSCYAQFPYDIPLTWYENIWNVFVDEVISGSRHLFNFFIPETKINNLRIHKSFWKWVYVYGTRKVIKGEAIHGVTDYRTVTHNMFLPYIQKNEYIFYEIVGFEDSGASIMQSVSTDQLKPFFDKKEFTNIQNKFGSTIVYKYGCLPNTWDVYVYRIAHMNEKNELIDYPWSYVKKRCNEMNIKHVPEIEQHLITDVSQVPELRKRIEYLTNGISLEDPIDNSHIREGVCVRIEGNDGSMKIKKSKNYHFLIMEGVVKDNGGVDEEEIQSETNEEIN